MNRRHATQGPSAEGAAVAERFRYFLEASGMSREDLVAGVDGAITAKSLFSVLNGTRRPSRALAVLMERTWGFRAAFLLEGQGPMWTSRGARADHGTRPAAPSAAAATTRPTRRLSPQEEAVVVFMRRSVDNARAMEHELARAQLWERLFARTMSLIGELEACAASDDPGDRAIYPLFVKLVYEECQFAAALHAQLGSLHVRRRVHRLTDRFLARYLDERPRAMLSEADHEALARTLRPVLARRAKGLRALDGSIEALRTTLENLVDLGSPRALLEETARERRAPRGRAFAEKVARVLGEIPPGALRGALRRDVDALLSEARGPSRVAPVTESLQRLARDLLAGLELEAEVASQSVEELRALHLATVAPLTA